MSRLATVQKPLCGTKLTPADAWHFTEREHTPPCSCGLSRLLNDVLLLTFSFADVCALVLLVFCVAFFRCCLANLGRLSCLVGC